MKNVLRAVVVILISLEYTTAIGRLSVVTYVDKLLEEPYTSTEFPGKVCPWNPDVELDFQEKES